MPQPVNEGKIHIARDGAILGTFEQDKIEDMLDTGHLLPTDHFYDGGKSAWRLLTSWTAPSLSPPPRPERRKIAREKKDGVCRGRLDCLFALGVAAGLWVATTCGKPSRA